MTDGVPGRRRPSRADQQPSIRRETSEFDRGLSFFDAIYGFAITLLITSLHLPPARAWRSLGALWDSSMPGQLGTFAISFAVIGMFWRLNVRLVQQLREMDQVTITANLIAAAFVILIPFTTRGLTDNQLAELALPTVLYALNIVAAILSQSAMFQIARHRGLESDPMSSRANRARVLNALIPVCVFALSVPVTLIWGGSIGKLSWLSFIVIGPLAGRLLANAKWSA